MANSGAELLSKTISTYLQGLGVNNASAGYTPDQLKAVAGTQKAAAETVSSTFDFFSWIKENWQLAVLGVVALLVLLKD